jgi:hypothetical protein
MAMKILSLLVYPVEAGEPRKMTMPEKRFRSATIMRWIARIWTIPVLVFVSLRIIMPDPYATEPVPLDDLFLLGLWLAAVLALLSAWKWELIGGAAVILILAVREVVWVVLKGPWLVNFLLVWLILVPPAALFIAAATLEKRSKQLADLG